jgi:argininosuccinate lyase
MIDGADELAQAGYAWEIADAPLLHQALTMADLSHVMELVRIGAIPVRSARTLARELLTLLASAPETVGYSAELGEMYSSREVYLRKRIGDEAGWLRSGRTRREAMRIAYRLVVREQVLDLVGAAGGLAQELLDLGEKHLGTVMPDYTYLQPAEPTTFGHYLVSFVDPILREADRLRAEFGNVNASPMGAGAASGSALLHEREVAGRDFGFSGPIPHVRDAMWQSDTFTHVLLAATTLVIGQDKLAEDLEIFTSREFDFITLGDGLVRPSVLMPQKRNPYALTIIRGTCGVLIGRATGQLSLAKSPSARSDLYIFAYGEVPRSLDMAIRTTRLSAAVVRTLGVNAPRMAAAFEGRSTGAAEIAAHLSGEFGIDYRTAHTIVAQAARAAQDASRDLRPEDIEVAASSVAGHPVTVDGGRLRALHDPVGQVAAHSGVGGSALAAMATYIEERRVLCSDIRRWVEQSQEATESGEADVLRRAQAFVDGPDHEEAMS